MEKIVLLFACISVSLAVEGLDLSKCFDNFACLKDEGNVFVIARSWLKNGEFDRCGPINVKNARQGGFEYVDVYMFPCRSQSAFDQVNSLIDHLNAELGESEQQKERELLEQAYGRIWLDVQTNPYKGCEWESDYEANCQYVKDLISAVEARGKKAGVYTSEYMWNIIMGSVEYCSQVATVPIWYGRFDNKNSFEGYNKIGGWSKPNIKQYTNTQEICGGEFDRNFYG